MRFKNGYKIISLIFVAALALAAFAACDKQSAGSPTEAYKMLYAAVKAKDIERIKKLVSKNSLALAEMSAQRYNQPLEKSLENGFLETNFADTLPPMRDERVKDNFGAVEIYNEKQKRWDDTAFILEDGAWKLAVGDLFKGNYQSPGKGQAQIESEKNNPMMNANMLPAPNTNGAFPMSNTAANANAKGKKIETAEVPVENANKKSAADKDKK